MFDIIAIIFIIIGIIIFLQYIWWDGYLKGINVGKRQILTEDLTRVERKIEDESRDNACTE